MTWDTWINATWEMLALMAGFGILFVILGLIAEYLRYRDLRNEARRDHAHDENDSAL